MDFRRTTASVALVALVMGTGATAAFADRGRGEGVGHARISQRFGDMGDFQWGLDNVIKMSAKGIFKGRAEGIFAPGAKITHQEAAVALVRLLDKETEAQALAAADVDTLLKNMPDSAQIATWAKPAVAQLVKLGAIDGTKAFAPLSDATRLDIAALLVKGMGYDAEAQAKMSVQLSFKDAHLIPANMVGYVAAAVDHKLITGYEDMTFRPNQAVKRIEMAVMMGRADGLVDRHKEDELKGTVKAVDATAKSITVTVENHGDTTVQLADDASIFVNGAEKTLADVTVGMKVEIKLDDTGKAEYIQVKTDAGSQNVVVNGALSAVTAPSGTSLGLITLNNVVYPVAPLAVITMDGKAATFADLRIGDTVKATTMLGVVMKVEAQRAVSTVSGAVAALTPATATAPAQVSVSVTANNTTTTTAYSLALNAEIKINGVAAQFADLKVGDTATITLSSGQVSKIVVLRQTVVQGTVAAVQPAPAGQTTTPETKGTVSVTYTLNGTATTVTYTVTSATQITVNGAAAQFADLHVADAVTATLQDSTLMKLEATR